jgi:hypothetical protein
VIEAMARRLKSLTHPLWTPAMAPTNRKKGVRSKRVHDSGDFQSVEHELNWFRIAEANLGTDFWAPTREIEIHCEALRRVLEDPRSFTVRISSPMIGDSPLRGMPHTSTVHAARKDVPQGSYVCPAPDQGNDRGDCRA